MINLNPAVVAVNYGNDQVTPTLRVANITDIGPVLVAGEKFLLTTPYSEYIFDKDKARRILESMVLDRNNNIVLLSVSEEDPRKVQGAIVGHKRQPTFSSDYVAIELFWFTDENVDRRATLELLQAYEKWAELVGCKFCQYAVLHDELPSDTETRHGYRTIETTKQKRLT